MNPSIPQTMKAAAIDRFGGPEELKPHTLPVPQPGEKQLLIRVEAAGIGVWDPYVREGQFGAEQARFPYVLGSDGAGTVVAVGKQVKRFKVGDRVYAHALEGTPSGFYAEYAAVPESNAAPIPKGLPVEEAGVLAVDGITGLCGLEQLSLQPGQSLLIYGASGGIGHLAIQLAKRMGAKVFAVASGDDGTRLALRVHADAAVDGHSPAKDLVQACRNFAPQGFDAALVLAGGEGRDELLKTIRSGGRIAYPHGVEPEPKGGPGVKVIDYDGEPSPERLARLNQLIEAGPFHVEVGKTFKLDEVATAHRQLHQHHLGKIGLRLH